MMKLIVHRGFSAEGKLNSFVKGATELIFDFDNGIELRVTNHQDRYDRLYEKLKTIGITRLANSEVNLQTGAVNIDMTAPSIPTAPGPAAAGFAGNQKFTQDVQGNLAALNNNASQAPTKFTQEPQGNINAISKEALDNFVSGNNAANDSVLKG